jgi:hypothetical protein
MKLLGPRLTVNSGTRSTPFRSVQRYCRSAANGRGSEAPDPFVRLERRVGQRGYRSAAAENTSSTS